MTTPKAVKHRYIKILPGGLQVVIPRLHFSRFVSFSGRAYEEVLRVAIEVRDQYLESQDQLSLLNSIPHINPTGGNNPLAGVVLTVRERAAGQIPSAYFRVSFKDSDGEYRFKIFGLRTYGSYLKAFEKAVRFRIKVSNLKVKPEDVPVIRPTVRQYVHIMSLVPDVPLPKPSKCY